MRNPYEYPNEWEAGGEPIEEENRFLCACGDPTCWLLDGDPSNVRIGKDIYAGGCAQKHPVIAEERDRAFRQDVIRDDFNWTRR